MDEAPPARREHLLTAARWLPLALYVLFVLAGITTSSLGVSYLREDPDHPLGHQVGESRTIRSDEWSTETPIWLGEMTGAAGTDANPLAAEPNYFAQLPSGPFSAVTFFEGTALRLGPVLPDTMLFAAKWWLPALLLWMFTPDWFRLVTGRRRWGYLAAALIFFAPATQWWSMRPVNTLGFMFAACALTIRAHGAFGDGRRWAVAGYAAAAAICYARFPSYYQPLAILVGLPLLVATVAFLFGSAARWRTTLLALLAVGVPAGLLTAATAWESLPSLQSGLDTVYPGDRVATGEANPLARVFAATVSGWAASVDEAGGAIINPTELASSFTLLVPVLVILLVAQRWLGERAHRWAFVAMAAAAAFWLSWCTIDWGPIGERLPLVNRVPSYRGNNAAGFPATIAFCLFLAQWRPGPTLRAAVGSGATAGFVTAYAGSSLRGDWLPGLSLRLVWTAAAITAVVVFWLVWRPESRLAYAAVVVAVVSLTWSVNPLVVGLGDLRESGTAQRMLQEGEQARDEGTLWASDDEFFDSLLTSSGVPSLSGRQQIGPVAEQWRRLDEDGSHEDLWNRGGLHIEFAWVPEAGIEWQQPYVDVVILKTSPCTLRQRVPELRHVVSTAPLPDACLVPQDPVTWRGSERYVYDVRG